jgi:hypothetical protein
MSFADSPKSFERIRFANKAADGEDKDNEDLDERQGEGHNESKGGHGLFGQKSFPEG